MIGKRKHRQTLSLSYLSVHQYSELETYFILLFIYFLYHSIIFIIISFLPSERNLSITRGRKKRILFYHFNNSILLSIYAYNTAFFQGIAGYLLREEVKYGSMTSRRLACTGFKSLEAHAYVIERGRKIEEERERDKE